MPKKSPAMNLESSSATPAVKKVTRRKNPSLPSIENQSFSYPAETERRPSRNYQKSSSASIVLVGLIVLILIAIGAYYASSYFKNKAAEEAAALEETQATEESAIATETPTAEAPTDPTASWQVFKLPGTATSTVLSFKYPKELQLTQNKDNLILTAPEVTSTQVMINWVKTNKTLKEYLAAMDKVNATGWEGKPSVSITTSTEAVVISSYPAVFRQQKLLAADLNQYVTYVKTTDTVYAISLAAPELDQNLLAFFVAFLNNFKFGQ